MVRKPEIQYVHEFYIHGSEAKVLELQPRKKRARTALPKVAPDKNIKIGVDPIALCGILVVAAMLVLMVVGVFQYMDASSENLRMRNQVISLQNQNVRLRQEYEAGFDLADVEQKALGLGMIPISEAEVKYINPVVPQREAEPTAWDDIVWFVQGLFA